MASQMVVTWIDSSNEASSLTVYGPALLADGTNWPAITAAFATILGALDDVTRGEIRDVRYVVGDQRLTNVIPTNGEREEKLYVRYQDDVTLKLYGMTIPCRYRERFAWKAGSDFADLSDTAISEQVALLAQLNGGAKSPAGNAITVVSIEKVGRNT